MKKALLLLMLVFLSGCFLLTHKEVGKKKTEELKTESSSPVAVLVPSNVKKWTEMEESLRELRGEMEATGKKGEDRLVELEKSLLTHFQTLDLRLAALENKIGKQGKVSKQDTSIIFKSAEKLFQNGKWKPAIVKYEQYRDQNKKGKFYVKSTFQIGLCFQNLNLNQEARVFFREVVQSFPKSLEAQKARKILSKK